MRLVISLALMTLPLVAAANLCEELARAICPAEDQVGKCLYFVNDQMQGPGTSRDIEADDRTTTYAVSGYSLLGVGVALGAAAAWVWLAQDNTAPTMRVSPLGVYGHF